MARNKHTRSCATTQVLADPEGALCDDSCDFALDGVCDDGTALSMDQRNEVFEKREWEDDIWGYYYYGNYLYGDDDFHYYDDDYYGAGYDYYVYSDEFRYYGALAAVCEVGTDCTDCSAARIAALNNPTDKCDNTCIWAKDGSCDDARTSGPCALGTDCYDCGPVSASNFTSWDDEDDAWWDDDGSAWNDDYWTSATPRLSTH